MITKHKLGWAHILLAIIVAVGLAARLHEVHYNFDGDEIFSVKLASKQFSEVIAGSLQDRPHPPLHNVLLHLWMKAFGASEVAARTLSVFFSGVFLVVSYVLLRRLVATWLALGLLAILALSPLFVYYGQQARPYALIACLSSVNLLAFMRVLDLPLDRRRLTMWATSCALLLYAQYLGIFLIALQITLALFCLRSGRLTISAYGFMGSVLILPWFMAAMGGLLLGGTDPLPHIAWIEPPSPTEFLWFYVSVFGGVLGLQSWLWLMLACLGAAYIKRLVASKHLSTPHVLLFLIGVGLPAVVYLISVWGPKPVFAWRQLLGAAIAFVMAVGLCLATLPRFVAAGFLLALLALTTAGLSQAFPHNAKPPWKDMAAHIDDLYGTIDVVTQDGWVRESLGYYRKAGPVRVWSKFSELEKQDVLFVCRPFRSMCSHMDIEALKPRRFLVETRRWGGETLKDNELRLYKISGVE